MTFHELMADVNPDQYRSWPKDKEDTFNKYPDYMKAAITSFKQEACSKAKELDPEKEQDWFSLSLGYFIAKGLTIDQAHDASLMSRYTFGYWC